MIIAAYLGSNNPAKLDQRYFSEKSESFRKKKGGGASKRQVAYKSNPLQGPKPFTFDRLMSVINKFKTHFNYCIDISWN